MDVYIASMNMRGIHAKYPKGCLRLNVTSAQSKSSLERLDFSPMSPFSPSSPSERGEEGEDDFYCFENYWQAGKVYEGIDYEITYNYFLNLREPKRRYPLNLVKKNGGVVTEGKGNILYGIYDGKKYDYIKARKKIYVPGYFKMMKKTESIEEWKEKVKKDPVVVFDFDGPRDEDGQPVCFKVTQELLQDKINDESFPFGHGYVVAAYLAGFKPKDYV